MRSRWVKHFIEQAKAKALMSLDANTQVGCTIVSEEDMVEVSSGYNCLARGVSHYKERSERPLKYFFTSHSEQSAIANAARLGRSLKGTTMIVTLFPCTSCCCSIINAGITKIISPPPDMDHPQYGEEYKYSLAMLQEAGIVLMLKEFD